MIVVRPGGKILEVHRRDDFEGGQTDRGTEYDVLADSKFALYAVATNQFPGATSVFALNLALGR